MCLEPKEDEEKMKSAEVIAISAALGDILLEIFSGVG
jgi:hypothetical protein